MHWTARILRAQIMSAQDARGPMNMSATSVALSQQNDGSANGFYGASARIRKVKVVLSADDLAVSVPPCARAISKAM